MVLPCSQGRCRQAEGYYKIIKYKNSFTHRYCVTEQVYYEEFSLIVDVTAREKQIKAGSRQKQNDLINSMNPEWQDLTEDLH